MLKRFLKTVITQSKLYTFNFSKEFNLKASFVENCEENHVPITELFKNNFK